MRNLWKNLLPLAALLAAPALRAADGRIPVATAPYTISAPGHYYLSQNLTLSSAGTAAITISAGDVDLDLDGHAVSHTGTGPTSGVSIGAVSNVHVHNGSINAASTAVYLNNGSGTGSNIRIANLRILNNNVNGIGISISSSPPGVITGVVIEGNSIFSSNRPAVSLNGIQGGRITNNVIRDTGTTYPELGVINCRALEISGNQLSGGGTGIDLENSPAAASGHKISENALQGQTFGFFLSGAQGNVFRQNTLATGSYGFYLLSGNDANVFEGNLVSYYGFGFFIANGGGTKNVYANNRWLNNTTATSIIPAGNQSGGNNCDGTVCN